MLRRKIYPLKLEIQLVNYVLYQQSITVLIPKFPYENKNIETLNKHLRSLRVFQCKQIILSILNSDKKMIMFIENIHNSLDLLLNTKINIVLFRTCVNIIKENKEEQMDRINIQGVRKLIKRLDYYDLGYFCQAFNIQLDHELLTQATKLLSKQKNYECVFRLLNAHKPNKQLASIVANQAKFEKNKQQLNLVIQHITKLGFVKEDFIQLHQQGLRLQMYEIYEQNGYESAEQVFRYNSKMMTLIVQKMMKDKKIKRRQVLSVCLRNPKIIPFLKEKVSQNEVQLFNDVKDNSLQTNLFQPSNKDKYYSLSQFGILQKDVIFLDSESPNLQIYLEQIANSELLGLDTQSLVARTKFSTDTELISTIQISNGKKAYILDARNLRNEKIGQILNKFFSNKNKILVGHTLLDDLSVTLKALGVTQKYECKCIDIKHNFKRMHPEMRAGLQSISQVILGKPICKEYTLTDWGRRPLLRNQIHYAALDAVVVIYIYHKIVQLQKNKKQ